MAINTSKALVGGLAAGVVANIIGFVLFGMLWDLGSRRRRWRSLPCCRAAA